MVTVLQRIYCICLKKQRVGVTKPTSVRADRNNRYFPNFTASFKHTLVVACQVYIWQLSPQLGCGDTSQIWISFNESNIYLWKIENFAYGEINEQSFSNPHSRFHNWLCCHGMDLTMFDEINLWHRLDKILSVDLAPQDRLFWAAHYFCKENTLNTVPVCIAHVTIILIVRNASWKDSRMYSQCTTQSP